MSNPPPIFAFGFERSGTTLLSAILDAHPLIAVPYSTSGFWSRYLQRNDRDSYAVDQLGHLNKLLANPSLQRLNTRINGRTLLNSLCEFTDDEIFLNFHRLYAKEKDKKLFINFEISIIDHMHIYYKKFTSAKFIHLVRDGRDVALSHETMPYGSANVLFCADHWSKRVSCNLKMGSMLDSDHYHIVRYEDIILEPHSTLRKLCNFLEIDFSDNMLLFYDKVPGRIPTDRIWLWPQIGSPLDRANAYRWRNAMPRYKRIIFERRAFALLDELGYECFHPLPRSVPASLAEQWYFASGSRLGRRLLGSFGYRPASELERRAGAGRFVRAEHSA